MYGFKFIIPIDIDEIIVPVQHRNWTQVMDFVREQDPTAMKFYGSFSVRNAYFFKNINNDLVLAPRIGGNNDESSGRRERGRVLNIVKYQVRSANLSQIGFSIKSFVNSQVAGTVFNHYPLTTILPAQRVNAHMSPDLVQMNHYREGCPNGLAQQCEENYMRHFTKDGKLAKFFPEVRRRFAEKVKHIFKSWV